MQNCITGSWSIWPWFDSKIYGYVHYTLTMIVTKTSLNIPCPLIIIYHIYLYYLMLIYKIYQCMICTFKSSISYVYSCTLHNMMICVSVLAYYHPVIIILVLCSLSIRSNIPKNFMINLHLTSKIENTILPVCPTCIIAKLLLSHTCTAISLQTRPEMSL